MKNGKILRNVKPRGIERPVVGNIYLLTPQDANTLFYEDEVRADIYLNASIEKIKEASTTPRHISIGAQKVAEAPTDADFDNAAVYRIQVAPEAGSKFHRLLRIDYRGDVARLYANGKLIADNFYNGRPFLYGLWRLPAGCTELELRILPLQPNMPIYFPREADTTPGETAKVCIE